MWPVNLILILICLICFIPEPSDNMREILQNVAKLHGVSNMRKLGHLNNFIKVGHAISEYVYWHGSLCMLNFMYAWPDRASIRDYNCNVYKWTTMSHYFSHRLDVPAMQMENCIEAVMHGKCIPELIVWSCHWKPCWVTLVNVCFIHGILPYCCVTLVVSCSVQFKT